MFIPDIIGLICDYIVDNNYYLLNKNIYQIIQSNEKSIMWKMKYDNFFINLNKSYLILNGDYNWKREYLRVINFNHWECIDKNKDNIYLSRYSLKYIPKEIGNLTNLKKLYLNENMIEEIPKELFNLINLEHLSIRKNNIKIIPTEISNLVNLNMIDLDYNNIEIIPESISKLNNLKVLDLQGNQIIKVPLILIELDAYRIDLKFNPLIDIPKEILAKWNVKSSNFNNRID